MFQTFWVAASRGTVSGDPRLRREIHAHTGNDEATQSILRSIDRFGVDASIQRFEVTPKARRRVTRDAHVVAWSVHAVRARPVQMLGVSRDTP